MRLTTARYHLARLSPAFGSAPSPRATRFCISNIILFTASDAPSAFGTSPDGEVQH